MKYISIFCLSLIVSACKNKNENFFHTNDFIQAQVTNVEKSIFSIKKITIQNESSDTVPVRKEDFRKLASDFLLLPDLTKRKFSNKYKEDKMYQQEVNKIVFSYTPIDEKTGILQEDVIIQPQAGNDLVKTIYINYILPSKDSTVQKRMLWETDKSFQITTITDVLQKPTRAITVKVYWE